MASFVVKFEGGLGAQVIAASAYFWLSRQHEVYADFSYFDQTPRTVTPSKGRAKSRKVSIWPWELDPFGLNPQDFAKHSSSRVVKTLSDKNNEKSALAIRGLCDSEVREKFRVPSFFGRYRAREGWPLKTGFDQESGYTAIHIRRGDYLNVASWMVGDSTLVDLARKNSQEIEQVVVCSDSHVPQKTIFSLRKSFKTVTVFEPKHANSVETMRLLIHSSVLIGSNSQFSLVAMLLGQAQGFFPARAILANASLLPPRIACY